ncbi:hypothetical protein BKA61DRAFT_617720 [Leptodontidium sp. MPI-SDFR-AT-0119]|nr:hypothetical protein BKA61DRAFT_617720 [Leptodontidium sp. MPI-SDFR-AT-0119]
MQQKGDLDIQEPLDRPLAGQLFENLFYTGEEMRGRFFLFHSASYPALKLSQYRTLHCIAFYIRPFFYFLLLVALQLCFILCYEEGAVGLWESIRKGGPKESSHRCTAKTEFNGYRPNFSGTLSFHTEPDSTRPFRNLPITQFATHHSITAFFISVPTKPTKNLLLPFSPPQREKLSTDRPVN